MTTPYILVIDDEPEIRRLVKEVLEDEGYLVGVAENGEQARALLRERRPDLVLLDVWMPDIDGITLFKECFIDEHRSMPVIVMSGHGTVETAVEATRLGAYEFLEKPLSLAKLLPAVEGALARRAQPPAPRYSAAVSEPIGRSRAMQHLREQVRRIAQHDERVLITGEAGSGKRLFAEYLHACSARRERPFVELSLGGLNEQNAEPVLLGREEAGRVVPGVLEQAHGGTLYLTGLADSSPWVQGRLLGLINTPRFYRLAGTSPIAVEVRIVCGESAELEAAVRRGEVREDLYYTLNVVPLTVPPLREHREDVPDLLSHFVNRFVQQEQLPYRSFALAAQNRLRNHDWPGNVRELENMVRRLLILGAGSEVSLGEVETALASAPQPVGPGVEIFDLPLREARERFERAYLEYLLQQTGGSVGKVAKLAGLERTHLYRKLRALGIDTKQEK